MAWRRFALSESLIVDYIERLHMTSKGYVNYFRVAKRSLESVWKIVLTMVRPCFAYNCTTREVKEAREAGIQFYRIPQDKAKRTLWLKAINREDFRATASTVICSQHFVGGERSWWLW